jgi:hypothetical protein
MYDEGFHLWFTKTNFIKILRIEEDTLKYTGIDINASMHMNRGEKPICVSTDYSVGLAMILYEHMSDDINAINQVIIFVRNIFTSPEIRLIDPMRICFKSRTFLIKWSK